MCSLANYKRKTFLWQIGQSVCALVLVLNSFCFTYLHHKYTCHKLQLWFCTNVCTHSPIWLLSIVHLWSVIMYRLSTLLLMCTRCYLVCGKMEFRLKWITHIKNYFHTKYSANEFFKTFFLFSFLFWWLFFRIIPIFFFFFRLG